MIKTFKILCLLVLLVVASSYILADDDSYFVFLHGKKQHVLVSGTSEPTIIFLSGKGRPFDDFKKVYNKIKNTNRIFAYDRAGLGLSEPFRNERTVDTMAVELHDLLEKDKIKPPYILVGHSLGTYIMRCFVDMYPTKVAGLVFIEPSHEYEFINGMQIRNDSDKVLFKAEFKNYLKFKGRTKGQNAESKKCFDFDSLGFSTNQNIVKNLKLPLHIPITVILSMVTDADNAYIDKELEYRNTYFQNWKLVCPQIKITFTNKAGHFIHKDEPSLIIDEINEIVNKVKAN